jgi:hypothetical protein
MDLRQYFETSEGMGALATSDSQGNIDAAIYARPHIMDDGTAAFIMRPRLSYKNIQSNPKAAYLFIEEGAGYNGKRLYLEKVREEADPAAVEQLRRRPGGQCGGEEQARVVYFRILNVRPLVGDHE